MNDFTALPPIADSALPREIREGSAADKKAYKAALGFEQVLVERLVEDMTEGSAPEGPHAAAVNEAMTDAVEAAGGLGLAPELYEAMKLQERGR